MPPPTAQYALLAAAALVSVAIFRLHSQAPPAHVLSANEARVGQQGRASTHRLSSLLAALPGGKLLPAAKANPVEPAAAADGQTGAEQARPAPAPANMIVSAQAEPAGGKTGARAARPSGAAAAYLPAYPCNVVPGVPTKGWATPVRPRSGLRDKRWACRQLKRGGRDQVWYSPRRNKNEERDLGSWFGKTGAGRVRVMCWDTTLPVDPANSCGAANMSVACPQNSWYVRAGIGNRLYMLSAAIGYAVENKLPFTTTTPLCEAGGPVPTDPADPSVQQAWGTLTAGTGECPLHHCRTPIGAKGAEGEGEWGNEFGQGTKTTRAMAAHRPLICDMAAAPAYVRQEDAPAHGEMVFHFRVDGKDGATAGFPSFPFIAAAVADAKANFGADRFVASAPPPPPPPPAPPPQKRCWPGVLRGRHLLATAMCGAHVRTPPIARGHAAPLPPLPTP